MTGVDPFSAQSAEVRTVLEAAAESAMAYLRSLDEQPARRAGEEGLPGHSGQRLPEIGQGALTTLKTLGDHASVAALHSSGPRFFNWATGGVTTAALAADWLTSALDQNARFWQSSPLAVELETLSLEWIKQLLQLPSDWSGTITTGATMGNYAGLAAARRWAGLRAGVDVEEAGLYAIPRIRLIASGLLHPTVRKAVSMLGLGRHSVETLGETVDGPLDVQRLAMELANGSQAATVVLATAGDVNGGRFDPIRPVAALCRRHDAWLHVDGAFGLFARGSPRSAHLLDGIEGADSVVCDAHKWLNVPHDCGIVFVKRRTYLEGAFRSAAAFEGQVHAQLSDVSPENSRRARGLVLWATLNAYGRLGYQRLVERHLDLAQRLSRQVADAPDFELLLPTTLNVVAFRYHPQAMDERTLDALNTSLGDALTRQIGVYIGSLARVAGRIGFRPVLLNWRTTEADIDAVLPAIREAVVAVYGSHVLDDWKRGAR